MEVLGKHIVVEHKATMKKSSLILNNEDKGHYEVEETIVQLGTDCPDTFNVGQKVLLSKYAEPVTVPLSMNRSEDNKNVTMKLIYRTEDVIAIL